ncbi:MAG: hypothetical protein WBQ94_13925, partial [Terracidiphilus sp.]
MKSTRLFTIVSVLILLCIPALAQVSTGTPSYGSFDGGPDIINLGNLNANWTIPVINKAGRAGMNFGYNLVYDSSIWYPVTSGGTTTWQPVANWGWKGLTEAGQAYASYLMTTTSGKCGQYGTGSYSETSYSGLVYSDAVGTMHHFGNGGTYITSTGGTSCPTAGIYPPPSANMTITAGDGSGITAISSISSSGFSVYFITKTGAVINPPIYINVVPTTSSSTTTDSNGNEITMTNGVYTDTLGQTALSVVGTAPSNTTLSYTNASGTSTYTVAYTSYNIKTAFNCSTVGEYSSTGVYLVSSITLPNGDGRSYQFSYEPNPQNPSYVTGRLASVTLPTGGTVSYVYTGGSNGIECSDGSTAGLNRTTPDGTTDYARSGSGTQWTTKITKPSLTNGVQDVTSINFLTGTIYYQTNFYEIERQNYAGSSSLLETVLHCYATCSPTAGDSGTSVNLPITKIQTTAQWPNSSGISSGSIDTFDSTGNVATHAVYDYGSAGSGVFSSTPLQTTTYYYDILESTSGDSSYPAEVKVADGAGNTVSDTISSYNETSVVATSGTPQHTSATYPFNRTSIKKLVTGTTWQKSTYTYFDTGNVDTSTDVNNGVTTYTYGNCGNSFPTSVTSQTGGSTVTSLTTSATWNCVGGVPLTGVDVNGNTTTYSYGSDPYWRPISVTSGTGATTSYSYPTSSSNSSSVAMNLSGSTSTSTSETTYDGLGRTLVQQTLQAPGSSYYDTVAIAYDSLGRIASQTLPYAGTLGQDAPGNPGTTTTYDPLNRPTQVADSGGGTKTYAYTQNDVLVTAGPAPSGENAKKRNLEYNGAGWLTSVCEITSSLPGYGACGQTTGYQGYLTKYTYDGGRLTQVQQNAQPGSSGTQTRTISYDDLGRKISETIPEWSAGGTGPGTSTYTYDSASGCGGSSTGDLIKSVDNMGNATCFTYDLLHRPTSSWVASGSYASVTPATYAVYDAASYNGTAMQNALGTVAEAYTCSTSPCSSKLTDIFFSASPASGNTAGGIQMQMWESTPHSGGYFLTQDTYYPNGAVGAISASLVGASTGSTTNLITDSTQVAGSGWWQYCAGNSNGMVLDTPAASAPDGSHTATQFTMPSSYACGSAGPWGALTNVQGGLTAGATYTVSAWLKGAVGGESVLVGLNDCMGAGFTLTTSWQRYTATFSSISSDVATCEGGAGIRGFQVIGYTANSTYYIWGPQTVQASTEEPYVATTDGAGTYIGIPSLTFGLDGEGRPSSATDLTNNLNLVTATAYNYASSPTSITYGNSSTGSGNDVDSFGYDSNTYRPTNLTYTIKPSSGSYAVSTALTWNANWSLQQMAYTDGSPSPLSQTCIYSADDLSRIASTSCGTSTWGQNFAYDPFGNIKKTVPGGYAGTAYNPTGYSTVTNQVSGGITPAPTYDANGNQTTSTPATLTWNALNQPISVNSTTATYDALGRMVEKGSGGTYTQFVYRP